MSGSKIHSRISAPRSETCFCGAEVRVAREGGAVGQAVASVAARVAAGGGVEGVDDGLEAEEEEGEVFEGGEGG